MNHTSGPMSCLAAIFIQWSMASKSSMSFLLTILIRGATPGNQMLIMLKLCSRRTFISCSGTSATVQPPISSLASSMVSSLMGRTSTSSGSSAVPSLARMVTLPVYLPGLEAAGEVLSVIQNQWLLPFSMSAG